MVKGRQLTVIPLLCIAALSIEASQRTENTLDSLDWVSEADGALPPIETMPELIDFVEADYPAAVYRRGIEGAVLLTLLVDEEGRVDSAFVERGLHPVLDSSACAAARAFRFTPAIAGGEPVAVMLQYEYRFSLKTALTSVSPYPNVEGVLLEQGTRSPIADAMVVLSFYDTASAELGFPFGKYLEHIGGFAGQYLEEERLVTTTDSAGRFTFYSVPPCSVGVAFPLPGYEALSDGVRVKAGEALALTYRLRRLSYSDYEIVVYGRTAEKEVARRRIDVAEIQRIPGLGGDALKVVQAMPGVSRPTFGSGEVIVRGAPTWDSRFFLDGIGIPGLYHFGGLKSIYNSKALAAIDFYPGGFGTRYGGATAGAIEITGRAGKSDRPHGTLDLSTVDGSFLLEGPLGDRASLILSGRRSFVGDIASWYVEHSPYNFPFSITPFYWDYLARADFRPAPGHSLFVTAFGSRDSLGVLFKEMQGGSKEIDEAVNAMGMAIMFHMGMAGWDWEIAAELRNSLRYGLTWFRNDFSLFGQLKTSSSGLTHALRDQLSWSPREKLTANLGLDADLMLMNLRLAIPAGDNLIRRDGVDSWLLGTVGGYLNVEWKPLEKLLIVPGIRYDHFPELNYRGAALPEFWDYEAFDNTTRFSGEPSLRTTVRYTPFDNHTFKASVGTYSQSPEPRGQAVLEGWGNPRLPATKAAHYVLGHEWQITDLIHSDVQVYLNRQWNIPRRAAAEDLATARGMEDLYIGDGLGRMRGVEIMLRHDRGERFFGWLAYTLSRSERVNPVTGRYELYGEDEPHHLQLVGSWRLRRQWETGLRFRFVSGKPSTPVIGRIEDEVDNSFEPLYGPKNSERMDPFVQLDLRVDKKFVFNKWMLSAYLDIQNAGWLLYKSPEFIMYDSFYRDKTVVSSIIMPALGFTAEF